MSGIDDKSRAVLAACCTGKVPVLIASTGLDITFQTYITSLADDHLLLENRVRPRFISRFIQGAQFSLQARMVRFQSDRISSDGESIIFPLKDDSVIEETRQAERYSFAADERVIAEILNPFDGETRLSKSVMDMSTTGLSLRTTFESKLFQSGNLLPQIQVLIDGEPYSKASGRVVYIRKLMDLSNHLRMQVGIKFEP